MRSHGRILASLMLGLGLAGCEREPPPAPSANGKLDLHPFFDAVDTNKDGCLSAAEWKAAGAPQSAYDMLHDNRGCVTYEKMTITPAPPGVDLNGDGKLTLEELKEFDKKMAPRADKAPPERKSPAE